MRIVTASGRVLEPVPSATLWASPNEAVLDAFVARTAHDSGATAHTYRSRRVRAGDFPPALRLGGPGSRALGWRRSDIESWRRDRRAA